MIPLQERQELSIDIKVALFIRDNQPCWFGKIEVGMPELTNYQISRSIDVLFDWGVIYGEYGETLPGRTGRLLLIDRHAMHILDNINPERQVM